MKWSVSKAIKEDQEVPPFDFRLYLYSLAPHVRYFEVTYHTEKDRMLVYAGNNRDVVLGLISEENFASLLEFSDVEEINILEEGGYLTTYAVLR